MESGVLGARNLIVGHDDLGVECEPLPRALLWGGNVGEENCQGPTFPPPQPLSKQGWESLCHHGRTTKGVATCPLGSDERRGHA